MSTETIIITGGNGFVGRHLVRELAENRPEARLVVWDQAADPQVNVEQQAVDITHPETYRGALGSLAPNWIVHLAAIAPVPSALKDPQLTFRVNVDATRSLLEAVREFNRAATRVLVISSSDIYGSISLTTGGSTALTLRRTQGTASLTAGGPGSDAPLPELPLAKARPRNPYAESKLAMEQMIEEDFGDVVVRARPFPHIGPGQARGFVTADFASQIAAIEADQQEPVLAVGTLTTQRDFTDVRDVARAYRLLLREDSVGEVYHVCSGTAVSIQTVLDRLLSLAKVDIAVKEDAERLRPSDIPVLVGSAARIQELTGWEPTYSLDQSLEDILEWWRQQIASLE